MKNRPSCEVSSEFGRSSSLERLCRISESRFLQLGLRMTSTQSLTGKEMGAVFAPSLIILSARITGGIV